MYSIGGLKNYKMFTNTPLLQKNRGKKNYTQKCEKAEIAQFRRVFAFMRKNRKEIVPFAGIHTKNNAWNVQLSQVQ